MKKLHFAVFVHLANAKTVVSLSMRSSNSAYHSCIVNYIDITYSLGSSASKNRLSRPSLASYRLNPFISNRVDGKSQTRRRQESVALSIFELKLVLTLIAAFYNGYHVYGSR